MSNQKEHWCNKTKWIVQPVYPSLLTIYSYCQYQTGIYQPTFCFPFSTTSLEEAAELERVRWWWNQSGWCNTEGLNNLNIFVHWQGQPPVQNYLSFTPELTQEEGGEHKTLYLAGARRAMNYHRQQNTPKNTESTGKKLKTSNYFNGKEQRSDLSLFCLLAETQKYLYAWKLLTETHAHQ